MSARGDVPSADDVATATLQLEQPSGAFYYLLPLPAGVGEEEAVRLLAARHQLLLLPGSAFGAPGTLRRSYGRLIEGEETAAVAARLANGALDLCKLAQQRQHCGTAHTI